MIVDIVKNRSLMQPIRSQECLKCYPITVNKKIDEGILVGRLIKSRVNYMQEFT